MAHILYISQSISPIITSFLVSLGHTVTTAESRTSAQLDALWATNPADIILMMSASAATMDKGNRPPLASAPGFWVRDKWASGVPVLFSASARVDAAFGIAQLPSAEIASTTVSGTISKAHPITSGLAVGSTYLLADAGWRYELFDPRDLDWANGNSGTVLATYDSRESAALVAFEKGDWILPSSPFNIFSPGTTAPARAVFAGFFHWSNLADPLAPDGKRLVQQAIEWVLSAPTPTAPPRRVIGSALVIGAPGVWYGNDMMHPYSYLIPEWDLDYALDIPAAEAIWDDHDILILYHGEAAQSPSAWVTDRWMNGTPILWAARGAGLGYTLMESLGISDGGNLFDFDANSYTFIASHDSLAGYSGEVLMLDYVPANYLGVVQSINALLAPGYLILYGTDRTGGVIEAGGELNGFGPTTHAPARMAMSPWLVGRATLAGARIGLATMRWLLGDEGFTPPDPVIPPPETYVPEVWVAGVEADTTRIRIASDTPAHLGIPPRGGHIAGAEADLEWEWPEDATTQAEQPWSGPWRPTPGAETVINLTGPDGLPFRAFTGEIEQTRVSLGNVPLRSTASDPLARTRVEFTAPALTFAMPIPPNTVPGTTASEDDRLFAGAASTYYVEAALDALGARSTVPTSTHTVWHQSMAGSAWPRVGTLTECKEWNGTAPVVPANDKISFGNLTDGQRLAVSNPYIKGITKPYFDPAAAWTIAHEVDPDATDDYWVGVGSPANQAMLGLHVTAAAVLAVTTDSAGTPTTRATMPRAGTTRALVRYDGVGTIEAVSDADPATVHTAAVILPYLGNTTAAVTIYGTARVGAVSIWRAGDPLATETATTWPRRAALRTSPIDNEQWDLKAHPPIVSEKATDWLARRSHAEQALLWTDHEGTTHWAESRAFDDLPTSGTITDAVVTGGDTAGLVGLDELTYSQRRKDEYSRVRVTGKAGTGVHAYTARPHLFAIGATETIQLQAGDAPFEMWLTPGNDRFWFGPLQTTMRRAGEPATLPWHKTRDFERGRGSWWGGHIVDSADEVVRWAQDDDMTVTVEEVGPASVLVTFTPGPGMAPGEAFKNLPAPTSPGLEDFPDIRRRPLPVLSAWAVSLTVDHDGVSDPIGPTAMPEFVHDAGWAATFYTGTRTPTALAEDIAHRHVDHVGEVYVRCETAPVRIGERWTVQVSSVADLTMDAVVLGVPTLEASAGAASMELRLWVLSVVAPE